MKSKMIKTLIIALTVTFSISMLASAINSTKPKNLSMTTVKSSVPMVKSVAKKVVKPPVKKPPVVSAAAKEAAVIVAIRKTCYLSTGYCVLLPIKVTNVKLGVALITTASKGYTQEQINTFNLGLKDGRLLYTYWLKTKHNYLIFSDENTDAIKGDWTDNMIAAIDLLHTTGINTPETDKLVSEFQFIAQEIINYQPYAIQADGFTDFKKWNNTAQSEGAMNARLAFAEIIGWFYGAK